MSNRSIVLKAIDFIECNLKDNISVLDIAKNACYSHYHFIRLFQSVTGFSPKSYIQQRRLSEAALELMNTDKKIIQIALDYQFGSHEAFSRAFRKQFKINPKEIKNGFSITTFPLLYRISENSIAAANTAKIFVPEVLSISQRAVVGYSLFVKENEDNRIITDLWGNFLQEFGMIENRVKPYRFYQIQYWSPDLELGGLFFFLGAEVTNLSKIRPQFSAKIIPSARYLRFVHKGLSKNVGYTYKYIYNQFLPETNYKLPYPFNFEYYGPRYKGADNKDSESDIFIPIE